MKRAVLSLILLLVAGVAQAQQGPAVQIPIGSISFTSVTDEMGTEHFINFTFRWKCEQSVEFGCWIVWDSDGGQEVITDLPPAPSSSEWVEEDVNAEPVSRREKGRLFVKVIANDGGDVQASRNFNADD